MHLFLDTNIYLAFYHFTDDDLNELHKVSELIEAKALALQLPEQVRREFHRNREKKISESRKGLRNQNLDLSFPRLCSAYPELAEMRRLQRQYAELHATLLAKIDEDAKNSSLKADQLVLSLLHRGQLIPSSNEIVAAARLRHSLGDPPGKKGSLGDAVNWEALLQGVPGGEPLHFVGGDGDFSSDLDNSAFNPVLSSEWSGKKGAPLDFYRTLSAFFKAHFPKIVLSTEDEAAKDSLIQELAGSLSFASTHQTVSKLSAYTEFTIGQRNAIVAAAISNSQVGWIARDLDVRRLFESVLADHEPEINPANLAKLKARLDP